MTPIATRPKSSGAKQARHNNRIDETENADRKTRGDNPAGAFGDLITQTSDFNIVRHEVLRDEG